MAKKIAEKTVSLQSFADMKILSGDEAVSPFAMDVKTIIAEVLAVEVEKIGDDNHIFYDLGATSIQYFDILTRLAQKFSINDYKQNDKYAYTVKEICKYLEKHV